MAIHPFVAFSPVRRLYLELMRRPIGGCPAA